MASIPSVLAYVGCFSSFSISRIIRILSLAVKHITPLLLHSFLVCVYFTECEQQNKGRLPQIRGPIFSSWGELTLLFAFLVRFILDLVYGTSIQHSLTPELQSLHGNRDLLQFFLDMYEVSQFITGDLTVHSDLD